ncbi:MAG: hypothetical protein CM1200mP2_32070 [Planctomycetaceae bacterium]|nr:MAG: hypothetical protein CM1200mP2_32070 [Planctomycetaceae bacterium]
MTWNVLPRGKGTGRKIGLGPEHDTQFLAPETGPTGWPASRAKPALRDKDRLKQINDTPITSVAQMRKVPGSSRRPGTGVPGRTRRGKRGRSKSPSPPVVS